MHTIAIEDGTIRNEKHDSHKRAKNWVALVERDKSQPGGLRRTFLERAPGGRVMAGAIEVGCWIEFAGDYYSCGGRKNPSREYCRVVEATEDKLTVEPCDASDVGKREEAEPVNPLAAYTDEELWAEIERRGLAVARGEV